MKRFVLSLACLMVLLPVTQGLAHDHSVDGFFRTRFIAADLQKGKDNSADVLADQRARVRWTMNVDENIQFVYYGEIDFAYGDSAYVTSRNQGGGASGDSVNLETKNIYVKAKIPDTPVTTTIGLQGYIDHVDFNLMIGDLAGVRFDAGFGPVKGNIGWFKMFEGDAGNRLGIGGSNNEDDSTLLAVQTQFAPMEALTLNVDGYYYQGKGGALHRAVVNIIGTDENLYYLTVSGKFAMPVATISGWLLYGGGTSENAQAYTKADGTPGVRDIDNSGLAMSVSGNVPLGDLKLGAIGIYYSSDDNLGNSDRTSLRIPWATDGNPVGLTIPFAANGLMILMPDMFGTTYHTGYGFAMQDAALSSYGLLGLIANASYTPSFMPNLWVKGAVGYFRSLEDNTGGSTNVAMKRGGKSIGAEICGRVGYKFGKLDVSLNGAYATLGDFYEFKAPGNSPTTNNPDNPYEIYAMVNVPF